MGFKDKFKKILVSDQPRSRKAGGGGEGAGTGFQGFIDDERNKAIRALLSGKEYSSEFEYGTRQGGDFRVIFTIKPGKFADFDTDPDNPPIRYSESPGVGVMMLSITNAVPGAPPVTADNCRKIVNLLSGGSARFTSSDLADEEGVYGKALILNFEYGD